MNAVDFTEDPDHRLIREAVRETCARFPDEYRAEREESHTFPWAFYEAMPSGGWIGIAIAADRPHHRLRTGNRRRPGGWDEGRAALFRPDRARRPDRL
jgi:hypothetical protein